MTAHPPLLSAQDLSCHYALPGNWLEKLRNRHDGQVLKAVDGVSFSIPRGTTFSVVGESGCGKSTLANMIVGLQRPTHGTIRFSKELGRGRGPRVQMIFQDPYSSLNPRWKVGTIVGEPLRELSLRDRGKPSTRRVHELLETVGLGAGAANKYPHEFSGGQRQRISIARALAAEPDFLICDEPTSALDVSVQAQILNLLKDLQAELGLTYLFISHDLSVVRHISDRVAVMYLGRMVEQAGARELFENPRHPYTRFLLDTVPDIEKPNRDREIGTIELPSATNPPSGCPYHPRCVYATPTCTSVAPAEQVSGHALVRCHNPFTARPSPVHKTGATPSAVR
ncbi:MAG: ABC transporter ATP-binding protein [Paracoccaceae bacterium]